MATENVACTNACTSDPEKRRKRPPKTVPPDDQKALSESLDEDFTKALMMIAGLPLSDAEKAVAVRRLLAGKGSNNE